MRMKESSKKEKINPLTAVILAAGKGTRMASTLPKVLHPVAGRPMIHSVIEACKESGIDDIRLVVGFAQNLVRTVVEPLGVHCYEQAQQNGTADAVRSAKVNDIEGDVLILNGDHPLIKGEHLSTFVREFQRSKADLALVTAVLKEPKEFGRIVRNRGDLVAVVEAKDASADTLKIKEINTGIYLVKADLLQELLPKVSNHNAKKEFYLTEIISMAISGGYKVITIQGDSRVAFGVNNQVELARASKFLYREKAKQLMEAGVMMIDPARTYIESSVAVGPGSVIYPNVFLRGQCSLGSFVVVEPNCFISDCQIADSVQVRANTYLENCKIQSRATLGPFARIRPGTEIGEEAHVGNFVEMKKVKFGKKSKAGHLTYLGDADIGEDVNIGCGTITCNYAVNREKYVTKIGNGVFVGSDTQFVAPVAIGDHAVIGSGSTITKDVPAKALAVARAKQFVKENYVSDPKKEEEGK